MGIQYIQGVQSCSICKCWGDNRILCYQCHNIVCDVCSEETILTDDITEERYEAVICDNCIDEIARSIEDIEAIQQEQQI